jgi:hypothetical protein
MTTMKAGRVLWSMVAFLGFGCGHPRSTTLRVSEGCPAWVAGYVASEAVSLRGAGLDVTMVDRPADADLTVACGSMAGETGDGRYLSRADRPTVLIDPERLRDGRRVMAAVGHEVLHWYLHTLAQPTQQHATWAHVCRYRGETAGCVPGCYGVALMNERGRETADDFQGGLSEAFAGGDTALVVSEPTACDRELVRQAEGFVSY